MEHRTISKELSSIEINHDSSTRAWNTLGKEWFELAQTGESRVHFIMPYTLAKLGDVAGKKILDLGCGEGGYSRMKMNFNHLLIAHRQKTVAPKIFREIVADYILIKLFPLIFIS